MDYSRFAGRKGKGKGPVNRKAEHPDRLLADLGASCERSEHDLKSCASRTFFGKEPQKRQFVLHFRLHSDCTGAVSWGWL